MLAALVIIGLATVHDGDTVRIGDENIRLAGIDAPELRQTCSQGARVIMCGRTSRDRLIAIIAGRPVRCEVKKSRDKYRRRIGTCWVGQTDLGRQMVLEGQAIAYRRYSMAYVGEEARARLAGRGLWGETFEQPGEWRKRR